MNIEETTPAAIMPDPFAPQLKKKIALWTQIFRGLAFAFGLIGVFVVVVVMFPPVSKAREKSRPSLVAKAPARPQQMAEQDSLSSPTTANRSDAGKIPVTAAAPVPSEKAVGGMSAENKPAQDTYVATTPTIKPPTSGYGLTDKIKIAYTANLSLETEHVASAVEKAEQLFNDNGGFVLNSNLNRANNSTEASVTGRVTTDKLATFLVELDKLGIPKTRTITGDDVTIAQIEQLEKMNQAGEAQVRLGDIGDKATKTGDALAIENQRRQAEREALAAKIEELRTNLRVTLATVTVSFFTPEKPEPPATIGATAMAALHGLQVFAIGLGTVLLVMLIWSPVWLLPLLVVWWLWRRYGKKETPPPTAKTE